LLLPVTIFFNLAAFCKVYFLIRRKKIRIVHVHNFFYNASPSVFWAAKLAGAKTLFTLHNYRLFCLNGIFFRAGAVCFDCHTNRNFKKGITETCFKSSGLFSYILSRSTLFHRKVGTWKNKVDRFVVINPFMKELLTDIGIAPEKIIYKPNVLAEYPRQNIGNYRERGDYYLYVGRLSAEKGIEHLVKAFAQSGKKLVMVGDGEMAAFVRSYAGTNIEYRGALSKEAVFHFYAHCKALIFPSLWIEGMPMTIIEAQSVGTIAIVAESVNTKRMIQTGENGFLYEAGNMNSLMQVIDIFESKNFDELTSLSNRVHRQFLEQYSETQYLKTAEQLYRV
jgi:glycosyltransferase involved in cell wall biosynthesis